MERLTCCSLLAPESIETDLALRSLIAPVLTELADEAELVVESSKVFLSILCVWDGLQTSSRSGSRSGNLVSEKTATATTTTAATSCEISHLRHARIANVKDEITFSSYPVSQKKEEVHTTPLLSPHGGSKVRLCVRVRTEANL